MRNYLLPVPRSVLPGIALPGSVLPGSAAFGHAGAAQARLRFSSALSLRAEGPVSANLLGDALRRVQHALARHAHPDAPPFTLQLRVEEADGELPRLGMDESYALRLDDSGAQLSARNHLGLLWALRALCQCLDAAVLHALAIDDAPRFPWRGVMLDPARRFLPLPSLLQALEAMSALRMNVLHLHLSDDQGFRLASTRVPLLGVLGGAGQCYSPDDIHRLVDAAAARGIRVVPELDMPGHCQSWLVAYPELAPEGQAWTLRTPFGIGRASLDPTRERTYEFIAELVAEVCSLFPDDHVHIGGDEVHPKAWQGIPHIDAFMAANALPDQRALQHRFTLRVCAILESLGRKAVAWDEVLGHPSPGSHALPANLVVQAWRCAAARDCALARGHDVLLSSAYYLDLSYASATHYAVDPGAPAATLAAWEDGLGALPGFAPVRKTLVTFHRWMRDEVQRSAPGAAASEVHANEHPEGAPQPGRLLGGEGCLWGELVDATVLPQRLISRLPALAERLWSEAEACDPRDLEDRLQHVVPAVFAAAGAEVDPVAQLCALRPETAWMQPVRALVGLLEPLKWYARLLGDDVLASRAMGEPDPPNRPYDTSTRLDRLVDMLAPESLPARRWLTAFAAWRSAPTREGAAALRPLLDAALIACDVVQRAPAAAAERDVLLPLARRVAELASAARRRLDGAAASAIDLVPAPPVGGMFIVIEDALLAWLREDGAA